MKRFKNILFITDGSRGEKIVLARAARLASTNKAKLTLFDSIEAEEYRFTDSENDSLIQRLVKERLKARREELEILRKRELEKHPQMRIALEVQTGNIARSAIRAVLMNHHDLVMKAPAGGIKRPRVLFGSTDQALMRKCPCPVWIVKPERKKYFRKILAAVDLNLNEPESEPLAKQIVSIATSLAKQERSELHVVHAWHLAGESKLRGRQIYAAKVDKILDEMRAACAGQLQALLKPYPYDKLTVHLVKGRAAAIIPEAVEKLEIDLVVIGTVGRSGVSGILIGNTAETVLNSVDCSVLTLKPEDFETPIKV